MTALVKFAGYDPMETEDGYRLEVVRKEKTKRLNPKAIRAYELFSVGRDTLEIAAMMNVKEPRVLRWISGARSHKLGLPYPYEAVT